MKYIKKFNENLQADISTQYSGGGQQRTLKIVDTSNNDTLIFNIDYEGNLEFLKWVLTTGREQVDNLYRQRNNQGNN